MVTYLVQFPVISLDHHRSTRSKVQLWLQAWYRRDLMNNLLEFKLFYRLFKLFCLNLYLYLITAKEQKLVFLRFCFLSLCNSFVPKNGLQLIHALLLYSLKTWKNKYQYMYNVFIDQNTYNVLIFFCTIIIIHLKDKWFRILGIIFAEQRYSSQINLKEIDILTNFRIILIKMLLLLLFNLLTCIHYTIICKLTITYICSVLCSQCLINFLGTFSVCFVRLSFLLSAIL